MHFTLNSSGGHKTLECIAIIFKGQRILILVVNESIIRQSFN